MALAEKLIDGNEITYVFGPLSKLQKFGASRLLDNIINDVYRERLKNPKIGYSIQAANDDDKNVLLDSFIKLRHRYIRNSNSSSFGYITRGAGLGAAFGMGCSYVITEYLQSVEPLLNVGQALQDMFLFVLPLTAMAGAFGGFIIHGELARDAEDSLKISNDAKF